jgi:hypothetical protein
VWLLSDCIKIKLLKNLSFNRGALAEAGKVEYACNQSTPNNISDKKTSSARKISKAAFFNSLEVNGIHDMVNERNIRMQAGANVRESRTTPPNQCSAELLVVD